MKTLQISFLRKILSYWSTLFIFSFCIIPISQSAEATFIWSPNSEPNLAGYKIYSGTASGDYNTSIDVGLPEINNEQVSAKITALTEGITYYFSATAYDSDGFESAFSQEVQWTALISEPLAAPENDFNGDGVADILLSNNASGSIWLFETNGNSEEIINSLDPSIFSTLTVIDTNDFNGDQKEDILFRSATTGQIWLFEMNGNTVINNTLIASVDLVWDIISTKDFNGDHIADILLRNADNGIIWLFEL
ncbi:VCBS repeat-containing protein, partial [candidate division KSB1 bacterium]|nr:VCBS repeat-containing protein [candidate division KSB1 bacterium]